MEAYLLAMEVASQTTEECSLEMGECDPGMAWECLAMVVCGAMETIDGTKAGHQTMAGTKATDLNMVARIRGSLAITLMGTSITDSMETFKSFLYVLNQSSF